jgi:hypothetical protein
MAAEYDRNFSPPKTALTVWADSNYIYVLLPTKPGAEIADPILKYPRSGQGLSTLIGLLYGHADNSGNPELFRPAKKLVGTPAQHNLAESILRRRGILK